MPLSLGASCSDCGAPDGECYHGLEGMPSGFAGDSRGRQRSIPGRVFVTTERVIRNGYLLYPVGASVPWERAEALGLTPPPVEKVVEKVVEAVTVPSGEDASPLDETADSGEVSDPTPDPATVAAVRRRTKRNPSAPLGSVSQ